MNEHKTEGAVETVNNAVMIFDRPVDDTIRDTMNRQTAIKKIIADTMKRDTHYGVIPGCGDKPTLYKAGAEIIAVASKIVLEHEYKPFYHESGDLTMTVISRARRYGEYLGEYIGVCSTLENKYHYRNANRKCPKCGKETIIKGREEYGGGWLCYAKKGGCGAKFADDDRNITDQPAGKVINTDVADLYNTVSKIAQKRADVGVIISVTGISDMFTQDLEEKDIIEDVIYDEHPVKENKRTVDPARGKIYDKIIKLKLGKDTISDLIKRDYNVEGLGALKTEQLEEVLAKLIEIARENEEANDEAKQQAAMTDIPFGEPEAKNE